MRTATRRLLLFGGANGVKDPDARAYGTAVGLLTTDPRLKLIETLIVALKTAGVWTFLDRLWLFAAQNATQALTDLVARASATAVNSPTFIVDRSAAGNGTTSYVDTNFNLSTGTNFKQNSGHIADWQTSPGFSGVLDGAAANGTWFGGNNTINGSVANAVAFNDTSSSAFRGLSRSGAASFTRYFNGAAEATTTDTSSAPLNLTYRLAGGRNFNGALNQANTAPWIFFSAGASLTGPQWLALYNAVNTYKTAVGA